MSGFGRVSHPLFFILVAALWSLSSAVSYPYTVTDELGAEVTLSAEPQRVVSMIPSHTETLCALKACDKLVGVDMFSNYPDEVNALPKLGSPFTPNVEAVLALEPDLVITEEYSDLAAALRNAGVTVYAGSPQTYEEVFPFFETLGGLVNRETEAALLVGRVRGGVEAIAERAGALEPVSVYFEIDATPYSVGPNSFIGALLARAGGANIVTEDLGDFPQLEPEYVVAADPEVIFINEADASGLEARPGWAGIAAVESARVAPMDTATSELVSRPGPRMVEAVRFFAQALHPEVFGAPQAPARSQAQPAESAP